MMAIVLLRRHRSSPDEDIFLGQWVMNNPAGIRTYPYSTSMTRNPRTCTTLFLPLIDSALSSLTDEHILGEVWASILNDVFWELVDARLGIAKNVFDVSQPHGNIVFLRLLFMSLKLMPCNPSFVQARDAMIQADVSLFEGLHVCSLWRGFSKRGLGLAADGSFVNDFQVPFECRSSKRRKTEN